MAEEKKWEIDLDKCLLSDDDSRIIDDLIRRLGKPDPKVEDIWRLMDEVWDELECDNLKPEPEKLKRFYNHPVWLLNGIFIEQDPVSMGHRIAIRSWIENRRNKVKRLLDFGGGQGTLGALIAKTGNGICIEIFEPYPSSSAEKKLKHLKNVKFVSEHSGFYDCLLSIDVLEHVVDPVGTLDRMIATLRQGGYMIIANNFHPVIKCHLPTTFHLKFSFRLLVHLMGMRREGPCPGSHAEVYVKTGKRIAWVWIKAAERVSKLLYYPLHIPYFFYWMAKHTIPR
jgi:2-polyprenyl-6-hydroxyphenyl methylase/3-demethylubiquinone-9 3-methyltransferase